MQLVPALGRARQCSMLFGVMYLYIVYICISFHMYTNVQKCSVYQ